MLEEKKKKKRQAWMKYENLLSMRQHLFKQNIFMLPGDFYSRILKEAGEELYELLGLFCKICWTRRLKRFCGKSKDEELRLRVKASVWGIALGQ